MVLTEPLLPVVFFQSNLMKGGLKHSRTSGGNNSYMLIVTSRQCS